MKRTIGSLVALVLLAWCLAAAGAPRERFWATMVVSGTVDINPDGSVRDYRLDQPEKLPPVVREVIQRTVPGWRFVVDTERPVIARARMTMRVVARPKASTQFSVEIEGTDFVDDAQDAAEQLTERYAPAPGHYPDVALHHVVMATVYVLVRVGRDGHVLDAGAEQVNFTSDCPRELRPTMIRAFSQTSVAAIRHWVFNPPTKGPDAGAASWYARVPVAYSLRGDGLRRAPGYGDWEPYLPGPRLKLPWADEALVAEAPDSAPDGRVTLLDGKPRLATR